MRRSVLGTYIIAALVRGSLGCGSGDDFGVAVDGGNTSDESGNEHGGCDGDCDVDSVIEADDGTTPSETDGSDTNNSCGNDFIDPGEECDGANIGDQTCESLGLADGVLSCSSDCTFATNKCGCADINLGTWTDEDASLLSIEACNGSSRYDGQACTGATGAGCETVVSVILPALTSLRIKASTDSVSLWASTSCEHVLLAQCLDRNAADDTNVAVISNATNAEATYYAVVDESIAGESRSVELSITANALEDPFCGNNLVDGTDVCDGEDLGGQTCITLGYDGGQLACSESCSGFITKNCRKCGNGVLEPGESCDGCVLSTGAIQFSGLCISRLGWACRVGMGMRAITVDYLLNRLSKW